jgi:putative MFS transporter
MRLLPAMPALSVHERRVLVATCLGSLGSFYSMAVMGIALPQIQRGLAIPEGELGSLFAILRFGNLFALGLAIAADRIGRRRLLIASVAGCALANLATAFAQTGLQLASLQLVTRCFVGAQMLLAGVVVSEELSAEHRGWGIGVLTAVGGMGGAVALLVFAFIDHVGWRALFVVGGFGLLGVPWLYRSLQETHRFSEHVRDADGTPTVAWQPLVDLVRRHGSRLAAVVGVVAPVALILEPGSVLVSKHLQDDLGYSPGGVGLLMGLCGIATPLGNMLAGSASDRLGRRPVTIAISLLLSVGVALFYDGTGLVALVIGLALLFFTMGGIMVLHLAIVTELFPTGFRSTAAGVREAVATLGASAGMWILSLLYGATGSHAVSIAWMLLLTPVAPIVLLFLPETAGRELEEIAPDRVRAS